MGSAELEKMPWEKSIDMLQASPQQLQSLKKKREELHK